MPRSRSLADITRFLHLKNIHYFIYPKTRRARHFGLSLFAIYIAVSDTILIELLETCVELVVSSLLCEKIVVVTTLDYLTLFEDHNGVGISDSG